MGFLLADQLALGNAGLNLVLLDEDGERLVLLLEGGVGLGEGVDCELSLAALGRSSSSTSNPL